MVADSMVAEKGHRHRFRFRRRHRHFFAGPRGGDALPPGGIAAASASAAASATAVNANFRARLKT